LALVRHPGFATSRRFVVFKLLGLLDFAAAPPGSPGRARRTSAACGFP
jgi:hypothetical protein